MPAFLIKNYRFFIPPSVTDGSLACLGVVVSLADSAVVCGVRCFYG
jgi:hypothetical protein